MQSTRSPRARLALYALVAASARCGNAALATAIVLSVFGAGGTASTGSILVACYTATSALLGPLLGARLDQSGRPRLGFLLSFGSMAAGALLLAVGLGWWPMAALVVVALATGAGQAAVTGAWSAQIRRIVPEISSGRAYAVDVGTYNIAEISGPAIVGAAVIFDSAVPGSIALEVVAFFFALAVLLLPLVPVQGAHGEQDLSLRETLARGLGTFTRSRTLMRSTIMSTLGYGSIAILVISCPLLAAELVGNAGYGGILLAVIAAGALVGSLLLARRPLSWGPEQVQLVSTLALGALLLVLALSPSMPIAFGVGFLVGLAESPMVTSVFQVRDRESPAATRSLVFVTAASLKTGMGSVGALAAAALAWHGWSFMLVVAGLWQGVSVLAAYVGTARMPAHATGR